MYYIIIFLKKKTLMRFYLSNLYEVNTVSIKNIKRGISAKIINIYKSPL